MINECTGWNAAEPTSVERSIGHLIEGWANTASCNYHECFSLRAFGPEA